MIDPLSTWKQNFGNLKQAPSPVWAFNMANVVDSSVTNKASLSGMGGPIVFTFNKAIFATSLLAMSVVPTIVAGAQQFATAWITAIKASTMVVSSGAYIGAPSPPTLFSVVASSLIDTSSIAAGGAEIVATLSAAMAVPLAANSALPIALHNAFLLLTVTTIGTNSVSPPAGPNPLTAPTVPVI